MGPAVATSSSFTLGETIANAVASSAASISPGLQHAQVQPNTHQQSSFHKGQSWLGQHQQAPFLGAASSSYGSSFFGVGPPPSAGHSPQVTGVVPVGVVTSAGPQGEVPRLPLELPGQPTLGLATAGVPNAAVAHSEAAANLVSAGRAWGGAGPSPAPLAPPLEQQAGIGGTPPPPWAGPNILPVGHHIPVGHQPFYHHLGRSSPGPCGRSPAAG